MISAYRIMIKPFEDQYCKTIKNIDTIIQQLMMEFVKIDWDDDKTSGFILDKNDHIIGQVKEIKIYWVFS